MLLSLGIILLTGLVLGHFFRLLKLPTLLGMILAGILVGPYLLNLISPDFLKFAGDMRQIALVVILLRAGLALDIKGLKKIGRPAFLLCFVPALFEIGAVIFFGSVFLNIPLLDAALMGTVLAAVSPAVIVPRMLTLIQRRYGQKKNIPQLIMAGAAVDDIFVIILFTALLGIYTGKQLSIYTFFQIPFSILSGTLVGVAFGFLSVQLFKKWHIRDSIKILMLLSFGFLFLGIEKQANNFIPFSALLAVMVLGMVILHRVPKVAQRLAVKFGKLWLGAEIILFVLVGLSVNVKYFSLIGFNLLIVLFLALIFRSIGVFVALFKTKLKSKEKIFCMLAYLPKATVQAAIGAIPFGLGLPNGQLILVMAVLSIIVTAPIGALAIDRSYQKLLSFDNE